MYTKALTTKINEDSRVVEAIASTAAVDRQGDTIDQSGWELTNFKENPVILWAHDYSQAPIAKATEIKLDADNNLVFKAEFPEEGISSHADMIWQLHKGGFMRAWSVGFIPKTAKGNEIQTMELLEISSVPVPANPEALSYIKSKGFDPKDFMKKSAVPFKAYPLQEIDAEWDATLAESNVRAWATDGEEVDFGKYQEAFAWYDTEDAEAFASYLLPHHTIVEGGGLTTNFTGVSEAMAALLSDTGPDIPAADREAVYDHLAGHYAEFDREPPAFSARSKDGEPEEDVSRETTEEETVETEESTKSVTDHEVKCPDCGAELNLVIESRQVGGEDETEDGDEAKTILTEEEAKGARKALQAIDKIAEDLNVLLKNKLNKK